MESSESQETLSSYERNLQGIPKSTLDRSTAVKLKLEAFYKILLEQTRERDVRRKETEERLAKEGCSEERKQRQWQHLARKESDFLRLRRLRLGVSDFNTLKVIGKGAFGEVPIHTLLKTIKTKVVLNHAIVFLFSVINR